MIDVIREFYIANDIKFDFIIYGTATNHIKDVINEVTKTLTNEILTNIMHIENIENWDHKLYQSAIIFTESLKNLNNLHKKSINTHTFDLTLQNALPKQFKFLTYIEEVEFIYIPEYKIFDYIYYRWPDMRMFQIFITMNQVSINLTAHVLFSPNMCGIFHLKHLNSFDLKTQKWNNELKNFNHFDNFYGCLMTFFVEDGIFWYFVDHNLVNYLKFAFENIKFHGLTHEILEKLTKDLNITGHYTYFDKTSKQYQSGSKNFIGYDAIASYFYSSEIVKNETTVHWSQPVYTMEIYYLVTQNDLYTNYEKLLMPFDFTTWIFLSVTISLAFGIILISFGLPKWLFTLIHGAGINDPTFKTLGVIFGIAQIKLPRESANRLILECFLCFCLIFRTCYQSMLFEFMTSDMRKQLPSSIEDLKEMNYTIVLEKSLTNYCERLNEEIINSRQRPNIIRVDRFEFNDLYKKALKEENKMKFAFLIDDISHANLNSTFKNSLQKMHNEKLLKMVGYSTNRNMLMQRQFDEILEKLIPSGITKYSGDYGKWLNFRPVDFEVKDSRRILSLTDLEFGFVIWLVSLSLPIACFLIEISIEYCRKIKKIVETFITSRFVEIILEVFMSY